MIKCCLYDSIKTEIKEYQLNSAARQSSTGTKSGGGESDGAAEGGCGGNSATPELQNSSFGFVSKKVRTSSKNDRQEILNDEYYSTEYFIHSLDVCFGGEHG